MRLDHLLSKSADLYDIDEIFIAMPSAPRTEIRDILDICKETSCKLRSLPGMYQLVNGEVSVSKLRDVEVEDLLGREPIRVDLDSILSYVQNKVVMVTGGGGSIGSELCRQVASHKPAHLVIVDIYENNAYDIQQELLQNFPELKLTVLIASVRNTKRINSIFETYRPDIIYHAAAHKHVPLMEVSPNEAIKNIFCKLCNFPALECLKILIFFTRYTVLIVIISLVNDIFRAEFITHFFFKLL